MSLRGDDRVLLLAMPPVKELAAMARILMRGVVVVLSEQDAAMAEFSNVMFLDASPESVPWRDGFFTKIYVPRQWERLAGSRCGAPGGMKIEFWPGGEPAAREILAMKSGAVNGCRRAKPGDRHQVSR